MFYKRVFVILFVLLIFLGVVGFAPQQDGNCPSFPTRLKVGDLAILPKDELNLRSKPVVRNNIIKVVPQFAQVRIVGEPVCHGGTRWFEAEYQGVRGWIAEVTSGGIYYLSPSSQHHDDNEDNVCNYDPGYCPSGDCAPQLYKLRGGQTEYFYIVAQCQFRKIPNESTMVSIGISLEFYPDGVPEGDYHNLPIGPEIPNVVTQYEEFCEFKNTYFPNVKLMEGSRVCGPAVEQPFVEGPTVGIVQIGPDIFVLIKGQRRLVPNPDTLDALGINRNMIDNMGMTSEELTAIPRGADIPDVNRDYQGFLEFKKEFDLYVAPGLGIGPGIQPTATPTEMPLPPDGYSGPQDPWCFIPGFCVDAAVSTGCQPQCMKTARENRKDLKEWGKSGTSDQILAIAQGKPTFTYKGQEMEVRIREPGEQPQAGDLIIWPWGCKDAWSPKDTAGNKLPGGHIGFVESGNPLRITDSNWGDAISETQCNTRTNADLKFDSCMRFITKPYPKASYQPPPIDKCSQYSGFRWLWCKLTSN